jgi:hypothetical protein
VVKEADKPITKGDLDRCIGRLEYVILAGVSYLIICMGIVTGQHFPVMALLGILVFVFGLSCMFLSGINKEEILW